MHSFLTVRMAPLLFGSFMMDPWRKGRGEESEPQTASRSRTDDFRICCQQMSKIKLDLRTCQSNVQND